MDEKLKKQLEALTSKAEKYTGPIPRSRRSSLHKIIKTKEQAERFMKALKSA
jgi:putative IMPACT (imprinted ancient) family translation regulator